MSRARLGVKVVARGVVQPVDGDLVGPRDQVPVDVHGHANRMVPQLVPHVGEVLSILDQEAGIGMPQGMRFAIAES